MTKQIVTLNNVSFAYEEQKVLQNINLSINQGDFIGLIGPNGGGKTTLIKLMLGLLPPETGEISFPSSATRSKKKDPSIGYVSQRVRTFNQGFPATVFEVVAMGLTAKIGYFRLMKKHHKEKVEEAIEAVGMKAYMKEKIGDLSGGQQQRVFIARALVNDPKILILDEPTVGIDDKNVKTFYELLKYLHEEKQMTLLLVTHDLQEMKNYVQNVIYINKTIQFSGTTSEYLKLSDAELMEFYTRTTNNNRDGFQ
ncbi:MAG TPA: metal ABC transporter ATP-binding protein [Bacillota bacterium]|nr:metal ABC transporter ATP-binding protein [Bacillota bacterium]